MPSHYDYDEERLKASAQGEAAAQGLGITSMENVADEASRIMAKDSPLMQKAAASGRQYANQRGLLNSSLAGAASQSAVLDQVLPMASQNADQTFRRSEAARSRYFQGSENDLSRRFQAGESEADRTFRAGESEADRTFQGGQNEAERGLRRDLGYLSADIDRERIASQEGMNEADIASRERISDATNQNRLDLAEISAQIDREQIASSELIAQWQIASKEALTSAQISANDRRGAESLLNNAFNDYENSIRSIMSNTNLPADERNQLLEGAKRMLTAKVDYVQDLYGADMDFPDNPWGYDGGSGSGGGVLIDGGGGFDSEFSGGNYYPSPDGSGGDDGYDGSAPSSAEYGGSYDDVDPSGPGGYY